MLHSNMKQMYPDNSAVEPSRAMKKVSAIVCLESEAPLKDLDRLIEAVQLHCDVNIPTTLERV